MRLKRIAPLARRLGVETVENPFALTESFIVSATHDVRCFFTNIFQANGSVSPCMVADHLLEIDENDIDSDWQKKALKESAATAYGGEHIQFNAFLSG